MSGGGHTSGDRKVIGLKLLIDKTRDRVIFAECDYEFIDTLLSFLTLPLGTVVRLLSPDSASIGSISQLYGSVSSLQVRHLRTVYCKGMLLNPRNASETQCSQLKLNIYPLEPAKLYRCGYWSNDFCMVSGRSNWFSTFKERRCRCQSPMNMEARVKEEDKAIANGGEEERGVFVKEGAARFMLTDDLQVIPGTTAACISVFRKLGINDGGEVEERTVEIGVKEVLRLLKFALLSKSPLTEAILLIEGSSTITDEDTVKFRQTKKAQSGKNARAANSNTMNLKLIVSKSKKRVLYAEAGVDVVDFLFSFLTFPLGSVIKLLGKNSGFGCMDNLYKSAEDLSAGSYIKSEECKKMLVSPKLAPFFSFENQLLQIEKASYPQYKLDVDRGLWLVTDSTKAESMSSPTEPLEERVHLAVVMDPKSPTGEVHAGKGYMKGPATFMITDNLFVAPLSPITSVAILSQLNVPISDIVERVVTMGNDEALNLLNASLLSKTALTDVFNWRDPYPEVMLKV